MWALFWLAVIAVSVAAGYFTAIYTSVPLSSALRERQRIDQERRLAELRLQQITSHAFQELLRGRRGE